MRIYRLAFVLTILLVTMSASAQIVSGPRWALISDSRMNLVIESGESRDLAANRIPQLVNVTIHNVSRSGGRISTSAFGVIDHYESIQAWLAGPWLTELDGVILDLGTNDWAAAKTPLWAFLQDYISILDSAAVRGIPVVCLTPTPRSDEQTLKHPPGQAQPANLTTWRQWISLACSAHSGHPLSGAWLVPEARPEWMPDGLHFSAAGHDEFARALVAWMRFLEYWDQIPTGAPGVK